MFILSPKLFSGNEFNNSMVYGCFGLFNISFTIGERTHNLLDINNERYFSLKLNLENVEKWLIKGED